MKIDVLKEFIKKSEKQPHSWLRRHGMSASLGVMLPLGAALAASEAKAAHDLGPKDYDDFHERDDFSDLQINTEADVTIIEKAAHGFKDFARDILQKFEGENGWDAIARENVSGTDTGWHNHADQALQQAPSHEPAWLPTAREVFDPMSSQDGSEYSLFNIESEVIGAIFDCDYSCYQMAEAASIDYADYIMTEGESQSNEVDAGHIHIEFVFNMDGGVIG